MIRYIYLKKHPFLYSCFRICIQYLNSKLAVLFSSIVNGRTTPSPCTNTLFQSSNLDLIPFEKHRYRAEDIRSPYFSSNLSRINIFSTVVPRRINLIPRPIRALKHNKGTLLEYTARVRSFSHPHYTNLRRV